MQYNNNRLRRKHDDYFWRIQHNDGLRTMRRIQHDDHPRIKRRMPHNEGGDASP